MGLQFSSVLKRPLYELTSSALLFALGTFLCHQFYTFIYYLAVSELLFAHATCMNVTMQQADIETKITGNAKLILNELPVISDFFSSILII